MYCGALQLFEALDVDIVIPVSGENVDGSGLTDRFERHQADGWRDQQSAIGRAGGDRLPDNARAEGVSCQAQLLW